MSPPHTETCEVTHKQSSKQHPSPAETANWKLTWEILTGKKKSTSHMTLNLLLVLLNDCVIIHIRGLHCKVLCFYYIQLQTLFDSRPASQVWRKHSPNQLWKKDHFSQDHSGYKETGQPSRHDWMPPHAASIANIKDITITNAIHLPSNQPQANIE